MKGDIAMHTWEIMILNDGMNIIYNEYHTGWYQEEAEAKAINLCKTCPGCTWQVIMLK